MKKELIIQNRYFKIVRHRNYKPTVASAVIRLQNSYLTIWDAYDRPSYAKVCIFTEWRAWADLASVNLFRVTSRNCFKFTLGGLWTDIEDGQEYYLYISDTKQEAYPVQ